MPTIIICTGCGLEKPHCAKGLCKQCYYIAYYAARPGYTQRQSRTYYLDHLSKKKAYSDAWYARNRERRRLGGKVYRLAHAERKNTTNRAWRLEHPEKTKVYSKSWKIRHPERASAVNRGVHQRRKAKLHSLPATLTKEQWAAIVAAYKGRCAYCGKKTERLAQDHVHPLSKGGGYTVDNIVPACKSCNSKKNVGPPLRPVQTLML